MFKNLKKRIEEQGKELSSNFLETGAGLIDNLVTNVRNTDSNGQPSSSRCHSPRSIPESLDSISVCSEVAQEPPANQVQQEAEKMHDLMEQNRLLAEECTKLREIISNKDNEIKVISSKFHDYEVRSSSHNQKIALLEKELLEMAESVTHYKEKMNLELDTYKNKIQEKDRIIDAMKRDTEDKIIYEYKREIDLLETELSEKNAALEEVHQHYQCKIEEKETELRAMHQEFNSSSVNEHSYQVKAMQRSLLQYQEENLRLKELLEIRTREEALSKEGHVDNRKLPEPTEFEYLKNIMFEYMMGREPVTLAKVISAVMRFSNDQTEQILKRQESIINPSLMPLNR